MGRILNTLAIVLAAAAGWGVHELYSPNKAPELQKPAQKAVAAAPEVNQTADKPDLESRISDTNVMAITNTGEALFNDGKYKEAAEQYKKASDAFPKDADMMYNYAISRVLNNPLDKETKTVLEKVIELNPKKSQAYRVLSYLYEREFNELKKNNPKNEEEQNYLREKAGELRKQWLTITIKPEAREWYKKGSALVMVSGSWEEEQECYKKALEISPEYADVWKDLGCGFNNHFEFEKAIVANTKAIELNPVYEFTWAGRAATYSNLKMYDKALRDIHTALTLNPDNCNVKDFLMRTEKKAVPKN